MNHFPFGIVNEITDNLHAPFSSGKTCTAEASHIEKHQLISIPKKGLEPGDRCTAIQIHSTTPPKTTKLSNSVFKLECFTR